MISASDAIGIPAATCETAAEAKFRTLARNDGASLRSRPGTAGGVGVASGRQFLCTAYELTEAPHRLHTKDAASMMQFMAAEQT